MRTHLIAIVAIVAACFFAATLAYSDVAPTKTQTGKVTAIDPEGKGIVVTVGKGDQALDVGAVVQPDTKLTVKGRNTPIADLQNDVSVGDTVTLKYAMTDDLYATQIIKR